MKFCVIGPEKKRFAEARLVNEGKKAFGNALYVPYSKIRISINSEARVLYGDVNLADFDAIIPRIPEDWMFSYVLMNSLSGAYSPLDTISFITGSNKILLYDVLMKSGIRVPKACLADSPESAEEALREMSYPIGVRAANSKEINMFALSRKEIGPMINTIRRMKSSIYLEERLTDGLIRCFVIGDEIIPLKLSAETEEKSMKAEGRWESVGIDPKTERLVLRASHVIGARICRVDYREKSESVVNVNIVPPMKLFSSVSGKNIPKMAVEFIKNEAKR